MKIYAYDGANMVPMALPEICSFYFGDNFKEIVPEYKFCHVNQIWKRNFFSDLSSNFSYNTALSSASCRILGYKPTTCAVTKNTSCGILPRLLPNFF